MTFDEVMADYGPALKRVAACYSPPGARRDDLEQEIALAIYQALPRFAARSSWRTYVFRIAHNCGISASRGHQRRQAREEAVEPEHHASETPGAETQLLARERHEQLASGLRKLPLSQRQALVLRLEGLRYDEIAEVLGISSEAVGLRIHRGKAHLSKILKASPDTRRHTPGASS